MGLITLAILLFAGYSAWRFLSEDDPRRRKALLSTALGYLVTIALSFVAFRNGLPWLMAAILIAYLLARVGVLKKAFKRVSGQVVGAEDPAPRMTRKKALEVLGVGEGASDQEINDRYRDLMRRVHPDQGGSSYLATELNEARRVLLGR